MNSAKICELRWRGPYRFYGGADRSLFNSMEAKKSGVYLWTVALKKQYLVYYVGETGRSFYTRFSEHARDCLYGYYRIYDPTSFAKGKKKLVWEGMWKPGTRDRIGEFLNRYLELSPIIYEYLGLFRIFLAPLDVEKRIRQRIENAIASQLLKQKGLISEFQDSDIKYYPRREDEEPILVKMARHENILGLCSEILA